MIQSAFQDSWSFREEEERGRREGRKEGVSFRMALLLGRHQVVDGLALLQLLLHLHQEFDAINHHLHQLHLREAQSVCIGNVKHSSNSSSVHTT